MSADGRTLVTSDVTGMITLWFGPALRRRDFQAPFSGLQSADLSSGNERIVMTFGTGALVRLVADGDQYFRFQNGDYGIARFSPDGSRIATTSKDRRVRLWGRAPRVVVAIASCQLSPENDLVARSITDRLARATGVPVVGQLTPVAYGPSAWDTARLGLPPRPGEVRYPANDSIARAAANWIALYWNATEGLADSVRLRVDPELSRARAQGATIDRARSGDGPAALTTVTIGACGAPARPTSSPAAVGRPPANSARYLVFYKDVRDSTEARVLADTLRSRGYNIRVVDVRPSAEATEIEQIRYFYPADAAQADSFAPILRDALEKAAVYGFTPRAANRSNDQRRGPPGQIEIWLPSLQQYKPK